MMTVEQPIKVLFFDHTAAWSGGEVCLFHIIAHLDRTRFEPTVVLGEEGPLAVRLREAGVEVRILPLPGAIGKARKDGLGWQSFFRWTQFFKIAGYCWRLRQLIRELHPALVFTNSLKSDLIGGMAGRLAGTRIVWNVQDRITPDYLPKAMVMLMRTMARWIPHAIMANSQATMETLRLPAKWRGSRARVVHCGVEIPESIERRGAEELKVGIIGRLAPWKGQEVFLRAVAKLAPDFPRARFWIVGSAMFGEGDYAARLPALADSLGICERVDFLGFRSDVQSILRELDVVVHASTSPEPFGLVIAEAMAAGRAVIATRGGGVTEIVDDDETGVLVPMGDAEALAASLSALLRDPARRAQLGANARRFAERALSVQRQAAEVMELLGSVAQSRRALRWPLPAREPLA